jgi:6-phosphogluconolactonase
VSPEKTVFPDLETLSFGLSEEVVRVIQSHLKEQEYFSIALAGGNTPKRLYEILAQSHGKEIPWSRIFIFFGDERCVPPDHLQSNFAMVQKALLSNIQIPSQNINRIPGEIDPPEKAAEVYEKVLKQYLHREGEAPSSFSFDLMLLGIGKDGHTASLFPGDNALNEVNRWVVSVTSPPYAEPRRRITLTLPVINESRNIFFMVSGEEKKDVVQSLMNEPDKAGVVFPGGMVSSPGRLHWFLDESAYDVVSG